jgi:hypothetical protein
MLPRERVRSAPHLDLSAPARESAAGLVPEASALSIPDPPEGRRGRADLGDRGEGHQVVGEGPDPAPALSEAPAVQQGHGSRRDR